MKTNVVALFASRSRVADFLALTKPRLNSLVVITAGIGYYLAETDSVDFLAMTHAVIGSALVAGAAAALNQVSERDLDEIMARTRQRPIPAGRIQPGEARLFATMLAAGGILELALGTNLVAALVALSTLVSYVGIYTPLKRRTPWATLVGAVPGALPPVIGWAAARNTVEVEALILFGIVFLWQLPHFHALSWMHRNDFRRANIPVLAVLDKNGRRTATHILLYTIMLVPVSLAPGFIETTDMVYIVGAFVLGIAFFVLALRFAIQHSVERARTLFLGSLIYLPMLWGLLVVERVF